MALTLNAVQQGMVYIIKPLIAVNSEGVANATTAYAQTLPTDNPLVTAETVDAVMAHRNDYIVAFTHAAGDAAIEALKQNPELGFVTTAANFACDNVENITHRSKTYPAAPGSDEKITKYGQSRTSYQATCAENKGLMKQTYAYIATNATEALA